MRDLLIAGFSVTEYSPGYAHDLAQRLPAACRFGVEICGVGGLHPDDFGYLFNALALRRPYPAILLDVTTSGFRSGRSDPAEFGAPIAVLLHKVLAHGALPILLHLYRSDVDPFDDPFTKICDVIAQRLGLPSINLAKAIAASDRVGRCFMDMVHPNAEGVAFYVDALLRALPPILGQLDAPRAPADPVLAGACDCIAVAALTAEARSGRFIRKGLGHDIVEITPDAPITLDLGAQHEVAGLAYITGPRSGVIRIAAGDDHRAIIGQDVFSYYERLTTTHVAPLVARHLTISVAPEPPDVMPLKGVRNMEPRLAKLAHIFVTRGGWPAIAARAGHLWAG